MEALRKYLEKACVKGRVKRVVVPPEFVSKLRGMNSFSEDERKLLRREGRLPEVGDEVDVIVDARLKPGYMEVLVIYR